ncbi:hypothetical protein ADK38_43250 [Streptomyces varsoviensis]|uniref:Small hydrophobic protein n=2 Tax=Streptomyces varsoviensis TaxID=67373 RepID=A0ABR5ISY2_9ACTN|nr:hypothetical protein ADK38_43250 [Streptomyces varsoviensis]
MREEDDQAQGAVGATRGGASRSHTMAAMIENAPAHEPAPSPAAAEAPASNGAGTEEYKERGVALRVFVYVVAGHFFAAFIWLLFYLGAHAE